MSRFLFCTFALWSLATIASEPVWPGKAWERVPAATLGMDPALLKQARDYALTGVGSGIITRYGRVVLSWGDQRKRYDLKSTTKSIGVTALGLAVGDGKLKLTDKASALHPKFGTPPDGNAKSGWLEDITLFHLGTQTAGF